MKLTRTELMRQLQQDLLQEARRLGLKDKFVDGRVYQLASRKSLASKLAPSNCTPKDHRIEEYQQHAAERVTEALTN